MSSVLAAPTPHTQTLSNHSLRHDSIVRFTDGTVLSAHRVQPLGQRHGWSEISAGRRLCLTLSEAQAPLPPASMNSQPECRNDVIELTCCCFLLSLLWDRCCFIIYDFMRCRGLFRGPWRRLMGVERLSCLSDTSWNGFEMDSGCIASLFGGFGWFLESVLASCLLCF